MTNKEIFKQSCLNCAFFGISTDVLNMVSSVHKPTFKDLREDMRNTVTRKMSESDAPEAMEALLELLDGRSHKFTDVLASVMGMAIVPSVSQVDIAIWLCQALRLMANRSYVVRYRHTLDSVGDYIQELHGHFIKQSESRIEVIRRFANYTFIITKVEADDDPTDTEDIRTSKSPTNAAGILMAYIDKSYAEGGAKEVLALICDWLQVAPTAGINENPFAALCAACIQTIEEQEEL